ncbi:MAG: hypothetical protein ACM3KE_00805 [Hyphomicrobiales bacterium]
MGRFDFVKEIGRKRFNRDEDAAEKIKKHIDEQNPGIEGLQVEFNNGVVPISEKATSTEAMDKKRLRSASGTPHTRLAPHTYRAESTSRLFENSRSYIR